jgi:tetratricopeptide (TPR) repeat protein
LLNELQLLDKANSYFTAGNYEKALFIYSQLCQNFPQNLEYEIYPIFCDIGLEDHEKAQSLFDYFIVSKDEDLETALKYVKDVIKAYDGDIDQMSKIMNDMSIQAQESLEAIRYEDFNTLVKTRGSFRIAFEDIMFSTKVAISSKEQFFDFLEKLIENNFYSTAYKYLDGYNEFFTYDNKIEDYYKILESKNIENINQQS